MDDERQLANIAYLRSEIIPIKEKVPIYAIQFKFN